MVQHKDLKKKQLLDMLYHIAEVNLKDMRTVDEDEDLSMDEKNELLAKFAAHLKPLEKYLRSLEIFRDYEDLYDKAMVTLGEYNYLACECTLCDVLN